jgi:hypothetical protein
MLYYQKCLDDKAKGLIINFELQPRYELQPAFIKDNKKHRKMEYVADFLIYHIGGSMEVIDVKEFSVPVAIMKKKLFNYKYIDLKLTWIVRNLKYGGWVEFEALKKSGKLNKKVAK